MIRPWHKLRLLISAAAIALCLSHAALSNAADAPHKITVLFDTNTLTEWKRSFADGLHDYFESSDHEQGKTRVSFEYLGLNDLPGGDLPDVLIEMLKYKQSIDPSDLVVSTLSPNAASLYEFGEDLYSGVPKIYALSSLELEARIQTKDPDVHFLYGTDESTIRNMLEVLPQLLPDTNHLYVVSGSSAVDLQFKNDAANVLAELNSELEIHYLTGLPLDRLISAVADVPKRAVVYLLTYQNDSQGNALDQADIAHAIVESSPAPTFALFRSLYIDGVVGGNFTNSYEAGRQVAEMSVAVIGGLPTDSILRIPVAFRFDDRQLRRWGIDRSALPTGTILDHPEYSFFELYASYIYAVAGVFVFLVVMLIMLKRQARSLDTQKSFLESVINSFPDAILITDPQGKIFASNRGVTNVFGYSQKDILGMRTENLLADDQITHAWSAVDTEKGDEPRIVRYVSQAGSAFSGETISTKITSSSGESLGRFTLVRDVTTRLTREGQHRQSQKMEALGKLVGGISHDFNNILAVITGYAELALLPDHGDARASSMSEILKATQRAKELVQQIMAFSRDTSVEQSPINLTLLISETMKLMKVSIPHNIGMVEELDGTGVTVMGTAVQIQQIVMNVVTNAAHSMQSSGGTLTVSLQPFVSTVDRNLSHGVMRAGSYAVLSVVDTGAGMTPEVIAKIFDPFFSTKDVGEGSGMGMTMVYNLIKAHSAMIDIQTTIDSGTCVSIYFPTVKVARAESKIESDESSLRGTGQCVLIVDDEEAVLTVQAGLLSSLGYDVQSVIDAESALFELRRRPDHYDLLLTDENMPKLTGLQLVREIRKFNSTIPVVICTGYSETLNQRETEKLRLSGVLRKPFTRKELSATLANVFSVERSRQSVR
jgi:two-component system cell cycle sensor histidine kinase/response regulator CckA